MIHFGSLMSDILVTFGSEWKGFLCYHVIETFYFFSFSKCMKGYIGEIGLFEPF